MNRKPIFFLAIALSTMKLVADAQTISIASGTSVRAASGTMLTSDLGITNKSTDADFSPIILQMTN